MQRISKALKNKGKKENILKRSTEAEDATQNKSKIFDTERLSTLVFES